MGIVLISEQEERKKQPIALAIECLEEAERRQLKQRRSTLMAIECETGEKSFCAAGAILHIASGWNGDEETSENKGPYRLIDELIGFDLRMSIEYLNDRERLSFNKITEMLKKGEGYVNSYVKNQIHKHYNFFGHPSRFYPSVEDIQKK